MNQPKLPRSFENAKVLPYCFNAKIGRFVIGKSNEQVLPENLNRVLIYSEDYAADKDLATLSAGFAIGERVVTGPTFHDFIETSKGQEVIRETPQVMFDVHNALHTVVVPKSTIGDSFGFEASRFRPGQVLLSVLGNCACFGPNLDGYAVRDSEWPLKFAEYEEHNIDYSAQIISLYAGIGYIAGKAVEF